MAKEKIAKNDFLKEDLPQTRKEQFFDLPKNQYKVFILIGLTLILFFLPLIAMSILKDTFNNKVHAMFLEGLINESDMQNGLFEIWIISDAINLVLYPLLFVGLAGIYRVIKQLVFGEPVTFKYDFNLGVKDNTKSFIFIAVLLALFRLLFDYLTIMLSPTPFLKVAIYVLFFFVLLPPFLVAMFYNVTYKNKFWLSIKHSSIIYLNGNWRFLIPICIGFVPYILLDLLLNFIIVRQIIFAILIIFALPLLLVASFMITYSRFDKFINVVNYPEAWRKGLYVSESERKEMLKMKKQMEK